MAWLFLLGLGYRIDACKVRLEFLVMRRRPQRKSGSRRLRACISVSLTCTAAWAAGSAAWDWRSMAPRCRYACRGPRPPRFADRVPSGSRAC